MKIKNLILGLAITILASFVAIYGIKTFYGSNPQYDDFCRNVAVPPVMINNSIQCESYGGSWISFNEVYKPELSAQIPGYCDFMKECSTKFDNASKSYLKNLFFITVPIGVLLVAIGAVLFSLEAIGGGIMLAGIVTWIYGASSYWPNAGNSFRFIVSLIGLIIVIVIGYWINKEVLKENKKKKSKK